MREQSLTPVRHIRRKLTESGVLPPASERLFTHHTHFHYQLRIRLTLDLHAVLLFRTCITAVPHLVLAVR